MKAGVAGLRRGGRSSRPDEGSLAGEGAGRRRLGPHGPAAGRDQASSRSTRRTSASSPSSPTWSIYLGHRGRLYWDITSIGHAAHTCHRHLAVNAIAKMVPLIEEVEALRYEPELPDWVEGALRPGALHRGRADLRRPPARRAVDDPRRVHDPDRLAAPAGRPDRRGQALIEGAIERARTRDPEARYEHCAGRREVVPPDRARPSSDRSPWREATESVTGRLPRMVAARGSQTRQVSGTWFPR